MYSMKSLAIPLSIRTVFTQKEEDLQKHTGMQCELNYHLESLSYNSTQLGHRIINNHKNQLPIFDETKELLDRSEYHYDEIRKIYEYYIERKYNYFDQEYIDYIMDTMRSALFIIMCYYSMKN